MARSRSLAEVVGENRSTTQTAIAPPGAVPAPAVSGKGLLSNIVGIVTGLVGPQAGTAPTPAQTGPRGSQAPRYEPR